VAWLTIKTFLKKCWVWIKHNWKAPIVVVFAIVAWLFFRKKGQAHKVLELRAKSYKEQIDAINRIHKEEIEKKNKILENYNNILSELEEKYKNDNKELDKEKKKEIKELVEEYNEKPEDLAKLLAEKYGLDYVE